MATIADLMQRRSPGAPTGLGGPSPVGPTPGANAAMTPGAAPVMPRPAHRQLGGRTAPLGPPPGAQPMPPMAGPAGPGAPMPPHQGPPPGSPQDVAMRAQKIMMDRAELRIGMILMRAVTDEPSYQVFRKVIAAVIGPQVAMQLGDTYQQAKPKMDAMLAQTGMMAQHVAAHGRALALIQKAKEAPTPHDQQRMWRAAVGTILSTAQNDPEWQGAIGQMRQAGAPPDVLNQFDTVHSAGAGHRALALAGEDAHPTFNNLIASLEQ